MIAGAAEYAPGESGAPVVAAGEYAVARRSANGARRMCVEKGDPLVRHFLQVGRLDFAIRVGWGDVTYAEVVRKNEDYIWMRLNVCVKG